MTRAKNDLTAEADRGSLPAWRATIRAEGRYIHLGYFMTAEEAADAYREASERFHGEHGRLQ